MISESGSTLAKIKTLIGVYLVAFDPTKLLNLVTNINRYYIKSQISNSHSI